MRRSSSVLLQSPNRRRSIGVLGTQNNVERHSIVLRLEHGLNVRRSDSFENKSKARKPSALPYTHPFSKLLRALVAEGSVSGSSKDSAAASMVDLHLP
ncbi:hypothetical protein HYQ45_014128 [Verticillium longisporum]|uniref:Uncharacterized protein n=1 Tax=Verticillium longisporum TaxID=100787 RepID=A0A8I2ZAH2_VERLO|nr:hypothetical protein HYQ45_014128 [Verticillium longisporum]